MTPFPRHPLRALALVVGLVSPALVWAADEPTVKDKPLSYWVKLLDEGGPTERKAAAKVFQQQSVDEKSLVKVVVPALAKAVKGDKLEGVRLESANALAYLGPLAKEAVPALADALNDKNAEVKLAAFKALEAIGPDAKAATPNLLAGMKDKDPEIRNRSVSVLGRIGDPSDEVMTAMKAAMTDSLGDERKAMFPSFVVLKALGGLGKPAVPILTDAATVLGAGKDGNGLGYHSGNFAEAMNSLAKIGPDAKEAVPTLIKLLGHKKGITHRQKAAEALGAIGPDAKEALPILEKMRGDDKDAGQAAADAIKKIKAK